jgi:hypothetical protein
MGGAYAFALMFCGSRRRTNAGTNWGPHALRDGERSARLCTSSTAPPRPHTPGDQGKRVTAIYWGSSGFPCIPCVFHETIYLGGSLAGPQVVLNGGAVVVKAKPLRGRHPTET